MLLEKVNKHVHIPKLIIITKSRCTENRLQDGWKVAYNNTVAVCSFTHDTITFYNKYNIPFSIEGNVSTLVYTKKVKKLEY